MKQLSTYIFLLCLALTSVSAFAKKKRVLTDYQNEIIYLNKEISNLAKKKSLKAEEAKQLSLTYYNLAYLSHDFDLFKKTENLLIYQKSFYPKEPFFAHLLAKLYFTLHEFSKAEKELAKARELTGEETQAYTELDKEISEANGNSKFKIPKELPEDIRWDELVKIANNTKLPKAIEIYTQAQSKLRRHQKRDYAWIELLKGIKYLEDEKYNTALKYFETANQSFSGYWLIEEHMAEVKLKQGKLKEAKELYLNVIRSSKKPEFYKQLSEIALKQDNLQEAARWERQAKSFEKAIKKHYPHALHHKH